MRAWRHRLERDFDPVHGGSRGAPKFPQSIPLEFLLGRLRRRPDDDGARRMLERTLHGMARGGLYDQLGGGFFRYSTDERWEIPHFEKMLYDNALLLPIYAEAWRVTADDSLRRTAEGVADWALRELHLPGGAFASSLDADSGGGEGAFYVWTHAELRGLLDTRELAAVEAVWGVTPHGNFEGANHLAGTATEAETARRLGVPEAEVVRRLGTARTKLRAARARRPRPGLDDKVLTAWNALMIRGLARAGRLLGRPDYVEAAVAAADFLHRELWQGGRLLAAWRDGRARFPAYLDDHAFLLDALLELLQARWRSDDLDHAAAIADRLLDSFADPAGGFYFTADDHERLLYRARGGADGALPSGTGIAVRGLLRLGRLLGRTDWLAAADRTLRAFAPDLARFPAAFGSLVLALEESLAEPRTVVLRGSPAALAPWHAALATGAGPGDQVFAIPPDAALPEALAVRTPRGEAVAYVCEGTRCLPPITTLEALSRTTRVDAG
ncbi:MAG: thioredoxin domain-containing protein [Deltaproteobacteria bacterium]|nr:thioredoxin domain-containing protein [Deltaproteobacteria bacterium]